MDEDDSTILGKQLVFREFGPPAEMLEMETDSLVPRSPEAGHVLVRIVAAPINPADLNTIEGTYGIKPVLPATPGIEGCGVVEASASADYSEGDRVIFLRRASTWASHTTVPAETLFKLPSGIDDLQAAMLKVNPATAWLLLHGAGDLPRGGWAIQNAGNSAVSRCVIQLGRDLGVSTISFVRKAAQIEPLQALGADHVFIDDESGHLAAKEVMGGANANVAFNSVGGDSALALMKLLCSGGTHITYGAMAKRPVIVPNGLLIFRDIRVRGLWVTRWIDEASGDEVRAVYENLAARVAAGKLVQPVDSVHPLENFREAFEKLTAADRDGKVLFSPVA